MSGIANHHHVARHCGETVIDGCQVLSRAFALRDNEPFVSVNWLEWNGGSCDEQSMQSVRTFVAKRRTIGSNSKFAILRVGDVRTIPAEVRRAQLAGDPSYAGIFPLGDVLDLADELASRAKCLVDGPTAT